MRSRACDRFARFAIGTFFSISYQHSSERCLVSVCVHTHTHTQSDNSYKHTLHYTVHTTPHTDAEYNELEDSYSGSGDGDGGRGRSSGKVHNNDEYSSSDNGRVNVDDDDDSSSSSGSSKDDNVSRSGDGEQPTFLVNEDEFSDFDIFDKDDSIFGLDPFARARETIYSKYHQEYV